jgi:23S rRNA pseudouridine2605 synthase
MSEEAIRLQKFLASAGIASRRESEELIKAGEVSVNGKKAKLGQKVTPGKDVVKYKGQAVLEQEKISILFNKPRGFLCNDDGRERDQKERLSHAFPELKGFPVVIGLEKDASGIILLSNDGDLLQSIAAKYKQIQRGFLIRVKDEISERDLKRITTGVTIDDQRYFLDSITLDKKEGDRVWYNISCTNQKDKMLEKLFKTVQHPIQRIQQIEFASIKDQHLKKGKGRILTHKELDILKENLNIK